MTVIIATAQYDISFLSNWQAYEDKITAWVIEAKANNAAILVFPEYASMELASLFSEEIYTSLTKQLTALQTLLADFIRLYQRLAVEYQCLIQAGSFPEYTSSGAFHNRAYVFFADGKYDYQEKLMMTRFEKEQWLIESGHGLKVFATDYGTIAINICYDSEFPLLARRQVEAGAELILVPSCTDTLAGYHRVKIGCQARALENQCYVAQACLVGLAPWSEAVDVNVGAAAIYTPVDKGFPDTGILVQGEINAVQWVYGAVDLANCATVRKQGQVFNYADWPAQETFLAPHAVD
jgi:predicted amidohydrolase